MGFKPSPIPSLVGFYGKVDLAKFGILYKNRTPGSDPVKGGPKGNIVEVDLKKNSQRVQPIWTS